jgi:hypothetical protein
MKRLASLCAVIPALLLVTPVATAAAPLAVKVFAPPIHIIGVNNDTTTSENWSGYAVQSSTEFTEVQGSWVQPAATCISLGKTYAAFWVGLDGYTSPSVEQLGTDSDCKGIGSASYYAWYEMYPASSVDLSTTQYPVKVGDTLTATVDRSGTSYTLSLHSSEGWNFSVSETGSEDNSSAEWVAEAPDICTLSIFCSNAKLTNFGSVTFSGSQASIGGSLSPISSFTADSGPHEITMTTSTGTTRAQPAALTSNGEGFGDTWKHA